jgi:hypothetical protein
MRVVQVEHRSVRGGLSSVTVEATESIRHPGLGFCTQRRGRKVDSVGGIRLEAVTESVSHWISEDRLYSLREKPNDFGSNDVALLVAGSFREYVFASWQGPALAGYMPGDLRRVDEVLAQGDAHVRPKREHVDGIDCIVAEISTSEWAYTVWLAPSRKGSILRVVRMREGESLSRWHEQRQAAIKSDDVEPPTRVTQVLDTVRLEIVDGKWVPVAAKFTETIEYAHGPPTMLWQSVERTKVDLNPSANSVPAPPVVPNGTRVELVGQRTPFIHEWRDGQILPREDSKTTAQLREFARNRRFAPYEKQRGWLGELGGPLLLSAPVLPLFLICYWRRKPRA